MPDVIVVGGGVIGLTTAFELSRRGASVSVLDQAEIGREASWAGAGMLPPAQLNSSDSVKSLQLESHRLWPVLSAELQSLTGIDNGFRNSGALQLQLHPDQNLAEEIAGYQQQSVPVKPLNSDELHQLEPELNHEIDTGYHLPTMCQVRNPWHLNALHAACLKQGVTFHPGQAVQDWDLSKSIVKSVITPGQSFSADQFVVTAGAWTSQLLTRFGIDLIVEPVRGQIVLLRVPQLPFTQILECGPRYLVPRHDGRILIGSTQEHVGFQKANTTAGIEGLLNFASKLIPTLQDATIEQTWSGLRPYSQTGPFIGKLAELQNLFVAAGHFRDGLSQSPATGKHLAQLMLNN